MFQSTLHWRPNIYNARNQKVTFTSILTTQHTHPEWINNSLFGPAGVYNFVFWLCENLMGNRLAYHWDCPSRAHILARSTDKNLHHNNSEWTSLFVCCEFIYFFSFSSAPPTHIFLFYTLSKHLLSYIFQHLVNADPLCVHYIQYFSALSAVFRLLNVFIWNVVFLIYLYWCVCVCVSNNVFRIWVNL